MKMRTELLDRMLKMLRALLDSILHKITAQIIKENATSSGDHICKMAILCLLSYCVNMRTLNF